MEGRCGFLMRRFNFCRALCGEGCFGAREGGKVGASVPAANGIGSYLHRDRYIRRQSTQASQRFWETPWG